MWGFSYWVFPVISSLCWLGMLFGLLIRWNVDGRPHYPSMDSRQKIAYISDAGAENLKPLFIVGSCVTAVFLDLSFLSERWLHHRNRLAANTTTTEKVVSGLSMAFALLGTVGLVLLSIFDTLRNPTLYDLFLLFFIVGYVVSAIFICWGYQRLGIYFPQHRVLLISFWIKLIFILFEIAMAVAFGACNFHKAYDEAAVLEWAIAFMFTFYIFSFFIDLLPVVKAKHVIRKFDAGPRETQMQMEENDQYAQGNEVRHMLEHGRTLGGGSAGTVNVVKLENGQAHVASNF